MKIGILPGRHVLRCLFLTLAFTLTAPVQAAESKTGTDTGAPPAVEDGLSAFLLVIGDYYRIPHSEVMSIRRRGIPPYEIPVNLLIAKKAHVAPDIITDIRLRDNPWLYTALRFGLGPETFYVPVGSIVRDPPYDRIYWGYQHKPRRKWKTIALGDDDIVNLVNLRWMSEHYRCPPEKIMKLKSVGKEFCAINNEIRKKPAP